MNPHNMNPNWAVAGPPVSFQGPGFGGHRHRHWMNHATQMTTSSDPEDRRGRRGGRGGHGPFGSGGFGRGPKVGRGDVRSAIISVLGTTPMHGYQLMQELEERSNGAWRPSPGSVYPTLQALEDEELITSPTTSGKRVFELTAAGRALLDAHPEYNDWLASISPTHSGGRALRELIGQVAAATMQVGQAGSSRQIEAAKGILNDTRRRLYKLLADDDTDQPTQD